MDTSIGNLKAALASATNEVTVAAANLNFDFSLVKYEAPKEFHPVGQLLSARRKYEAEDGTCHTTARRLAALFAGVCPQTPELIRAYGQRASEIAREATGKVSKEHFASVFSQYTGVDATSMWAAATSSKDANGGAIHVHLLACLLASRWEAPEAISIWFQIIAERRNEIALRVQRGEEVEFATATAAAQQEIPRQQLAAWDASARSWLETADGVKQKEQAQLRLILANIEFSVDRLPTVYSNVVKVWKTAITTMDNLVSGIAQEAYDGLTIIGLSAWHLYPDMHVFGRRKVEVKMNDDLIPKGGVLSLGCSPSATTPKSGITWSLSLANLKFYGTPVETTASMQGDLSRLTVREFRLVLLGSLLRIWNIAPTQESTTARILAALSRNIRRQLIHDFGPDVTLGRHTDAYLFLEKVEADYRAHKLDSGVFITLGRNRPQFHPKDHIKDQKAFGYRPFFGLLETNTFLKCLRSPQDRVNALRRCASRNEKLRDRPVIIRYMENTTQFHYMVLHSDTGTGSTLATAGSPYQPMRWLDPNMTIPVEPTPFRDTDDRYRARADTSKSKNEGDVKGPEKFSDDGKWENDIPMAESTYEDHDSLFGSIGQDDGDDDANGDKEEDDSHEEEEEEDDSHEYEDISLLMDSDLTFESRGLPYQFLFGHSASAAIFVPIGWTTPPLFIEPEDIMWALEHDILGYTGVLDVMALDAAIPWLTVYEYALRCLQGLSGPVISVRTLKNSPENSKWASEWRNATIASDDTARPVTTREILSVLAYFLARCDIGPSELGPSTAGISYGNSIYVPTELLHDPLVSRTGHRGVTRILGNIGQPGLVIFSSVSNPMSAPMDDNFWRVANMNRFDGRPENHFGSTSMHLSFTQWERSLDTADSHGKQDVQLTKKESVVSIRESGRWVGDVDVMAALRSPYIYTLQPQAPCGHTGADQPQNHLLRSIECWDELRECQSGLAVVRVHGNWLARLAVTAYLAQQADKMGGKGARITLLPAKVCWACLEHKFQSNIYIY